MGFGSVCAVVSVFVVPLAAFFIADRMSCSCRSAVLHTGCKAKFTSNVVLVLDLINKLQYKMAGERQHLPKEAEESSTTRDGDTRKATGIHTYIVVHVAHHRAQRGSTTRGEFWLSLTMYDDVK